MTGSHMCWRLGCGLPLRRRVPEAVCRVLPLAREAQMKATSFRISSTSACETDSSRTLVSRLPALVAIRLDSVLQFG